MCFEFKKHGMNKLVFFSIFLLLSTYGKAQNPDLYNQTWYLHEIIDEESEDFYVEGYQPYGGDPEIEQITPYFILDSNLNFNGVGICNPFNGVLEYDETSDSFRAISTNVETSSCGVFEDMDEPRVIGPFGFIDSDPTSFTIINPTITNDEDGYQTFSFITQPFVNYTYRNVSVLSVNDFEKDVFTIYPNPTSDIIQFSSQSNSIITSIEVYSVLGSKVMEISDPNSLKTITLSSLNKGVYFIKIYSDQKSEIHQIIKK